ncbi:MAG: hypothetical protein HW387_1233 [Parachlamydiales bacterium]|nr:hypothetical protein [Parachlamydiales bacterium]
MVLFIYGNPVAPAHGWWCRTPDLQNVQKVFRHCLFCGKDRFPETWDFKGINTTDSFFACCESEVCRKIQLILAKKGILNLVFSCIGCKPFVSQKDICNGLINIGIRNVEIMSVLSSGTTR